MEKAENTVIFDGIQYDPGDELPDIISESVSRMVAVCDYWSRSGKTFYQSILSRISSSDSGFKNSSVDSARICEHIFDSVLESIVFASRNLFNTCSEYSYFVPQFGHDILSIVIF